jgi:ubiquitin-protein ligase
VLQNQWSPVYDVWSVLTAIRLLLAEPNTLAPANSIASRMFKENKLMYEQKVREIA